MPLFSEPLKDIIWEDMDIYKTWILMFSWECHHSLMKTFMKYGLEGTFWHRLCHSFKLLILSVLHIFWNVQLVKHGAPLRIAAACLVNVYTTLRQFCAVTVDNVSSPYLNTASVANNILSSIQVLIHLIEHPYPMGICIIHTLQIREWALDDTDKRWQVPDTNWHLIP